MKHFYVYYSYEEYGRGYIGKRECKCLPEEDISYFGSFHDKTFRPTQKIILETFDNVEEALGAECVLHNFYEVDYLPENDRIRFTIHPEARKEILKRLLALNHKIHDEEIQDETNSLISKKKSKSLKVKNQDQSELF